MTLRGTSFEGKERGEQFALPVKKYILLYFKGHETLLSNAREERNMDGTLGIHKSQQ